MAQPYFAEQSNSFERAVELGSQNSLSDQDIQELIDTPLPQYDYGIETIKTTRRDELDTADGRYWERAVTMSDGQRHTEILGLSNNPNADELVVSIPAWWTRLDGGLNKVTSDTLHQRGKHTLTKGVAENRFASLSRGAHDVHVVLNHADDGLNYYFDTTKIYVHGDSNGAMQGTGILGYASAHNREVIDAYLVDPCIVRRIQKPDVDKLLTHPTYLPKEVLSIARQVIRIANHPDMDLKECAKTIESNPSRILGNLMLGRALFSGEFGLLLAHLPPEQRSHYLLFNHSMANQKRIMLQILDTIDSKATIDVRTGTHTSIANPRVLSEKIDYISTKPRLQIVS